VLNWSTGGMLAPKDDRLKQPLKRSRVAISEYADASGRERGADTDRGVGELVEDDAASLAHDVQEDGLSGRQAEAHRNDCRIVLADGVGEVRWWRSCVPLSSRVPHPPTPHHPVPSWTTSVQPPRT
jgi:hypothetical protein